MALITPDGIVNVYRDPNLNFYTYQNKGWCGSFQKISPKEVLREEIKLAEVSDQAPFWNTTPEIQQQDSAFFFAKPRWLFNKISPEQWARLVSLYEHYAFSLSNKNLEVGTFILFNESTQDLELVLPDQTVTPTNIKFENFLEKNASSLDGVESKALKEWLQTHTFLGYCHSHNTMTLDTPSTVDDKTELDFNGIHILLSCFKQTEESFLPEFRVTCSYSLHGQRFFVEPEEFIESVELEEDFYYTNTFEVGLEGVKIRTFPRVKTKKYQPLLPSNSKGFSVAEVYEDPFGYYDDSEIFYPNFYDQENVTLPSVIESALDKLVRASFLEKKFKSEKELVSSLAKILEDTDWKKELEKSLYIQKKVIQSSKTELPTLNTAVTYEVL